MSTVELRVRVGGVHVDHADLTALSPAARALAEALASWPRGVRGPVHLRQAVGTRQDIAPPGRDLDHAALFVDLDQPDECLWDSWSVYPEASAVPVEAWLEWQATKFPRGYAVVARDGLSPWVPSAAAALAEAALTARLVPLNELLLHLAKRGRVIEKNTYTAYAARRQAPAPVLDRRPALYSLDEANDWLDSRPGHDDAAPTRR